MSGMREINLRQSQIQRATKSVKERYMTRTVQHLFQSGDHQCNDVIYMERTHRVAMYQAGKKNCSHRKGTCQNTVDYAPPQ